MTTPTLPRAAVLLATALLPHHVRARWREELLADLEHLPDRERARFARGVLRRAVSLRRATADVPVEPFAASSWTCRLRLRHHFRGYSADDGGRYTRCARCGLDRVSARAVAYSEIPWSGLG